MGIKLLYYFGFKFPGRLTSYRLIFNVVSSSMCNLISDHKDIFCISITKYILAFFPNSKNCNVGNWQIATDILINCNHQGQKNRISHEGLKIVSPEILRHAKIATKIHKFLFYNCLPV